MTGFAEYGPQPWRRADVRIFAAGQVVGLALLLIAWALASGEVRPSDQMPAVNIGVAGAAIAVAAGARFLGRGRLSLGGRRATVSDGLRHTAGPADVTAAIDRNLRVASEAEGRLVSSDSMTRYHRAGCQLVTGKATAFGPRRVHEVAGKLPCRVCRP